MRPTLPQTIVLAIAVLCLDSAVAQTTSFTFQGRLKKAGNLQTTAADLKFRLYDAETLGNPVGSELVFESGSAIPVTNGLFSVALDFGAAVFDGTPLWLEMDARVPSGAESYETTTPRQPLTAAPFANHANGPWATSVNNISFTGGRVGVGTSSPETHFHVEVATRLR